MFGTTVGQGIGSNIPSQLTKRKPSKKAKKNIPRYHDYIADYGGCGHWRMLWPQMILNSLQSTIGSNTSAMILDDQFYRDLTSVKIQRQVTPNQLKFVKILREKANRLGFKLIYDIDDIFVIEDIPKYNAFRTAYEDPKLQQSAKEIMSLMDVVTVPSEPMKQYYSKFNNNVQLLKNYPPRFWLDGYYNHDNVMKSLVSSKRPRVVYSGSTAHFDVRNNNNGVDDFSHVVPLVQKTTDKYEWVFIGALPPNLKPLLRAGKIKLYEWCNIYNLPAFVSTLKAHAFIAPLNDNVFNRCKSDIKIIEAGGFGIPCICQDIVTYKEAPLKFKTGDELGDQLHTIFNNESTYSKHSKKYNNITKQRWLDDNYSNHINLISKK